MPRILIRLLIVLILLPLPHIARAQDLRVFQTNHYRIHTDLDQELSDDLATRLEGMYAEYARRLADFPRPADSRPLEVYLVHDQQKYLHLAGITLAGTGGAFNASRHLLAAFLDGQGRDSLRRTLQHEAFHQFAADAIGPSLPIWLNEGLAQVFEEGIWDGHGFLLGQIPPRRVRELMKMIHENTLIEFTSMLTMSPAHWSAGWHDPDISSRRYNQAWAMTHFLIYAADSTGRPKYRDRLLQMLKLIHNGEDGDAAFRQALSDNVGGFRDRFMEFARAMRPTPQATLLEDQSTLADMLVAMAKKGRYINTMDQFKNTMIREHWIIHYRSGGLQWESASDPGVYFRSADGAPLTDEEEHFELAGSRPLEDLVCRRDGLSLRTRFSESNGKIEHETLVESGS